MTKSQLLSTQQNANETKQESGKIIDFLEIEGTPFKIVVTEKKYFIAIGNQRMTELMDSYNECIEYLEENQWDMTTKLIAFMLDNWQTFKNQ